MTATIDQRVVQMAFQNGEFEKNVGTTMTTLDRLKKSLNFGDTSKTFDGLNDSARRVNLGSISDGVNNIASRFSAMGIIGMGVLLNLANSAVEAGKKIFNALLIDPIKTGLNEYETKLNSVQTILANTQKEGTNLKTVTDALNTLNEYSDKTIYNFQQMTRNVGTFTAAGVKLDVAVASIKGIANLAAISGSSADQASNAMYQLSQALSTGTVKLMDWNSVVNSGMGGQVFQDAVVETARVNGVAIDQMIKDAGSFRASLEKGWFTSEILSQTLAKFTGDLNADQLRTMGYSEEQIASIIKLGQTANDAATKVKTFTQLFDTLKEAAQSGWAQTWELVIGDFEEAKLFLTDLNNWFGSMIGASADARNAIIKGWSDLGGRTKMIEALQNVLNSIVLVINPIREGMKEIFPPITAQNLFNITNGIANLTKTLIPTGKTMDQIKRIFRGLFAVLDIGKMAVLAIGKEFGRLLGFLSPVPGGLAEILARFGDWLLTVRNLIKQNDLFGKIMRTIGNAILVVAGVISKAIEAIVVAAKRFKELKATDGILKAFTGGIQAFFDFFKNLDFSVLKGFIERIVERFKPLSKLKDILSNALKGGEAAANPFIEKLSKIATNIKEAIGKFVLTILDKLSKIDFSNIKFNGIFDGINSGLLAALLFSVTRFVTKGTGIFGSIVDIFKGIGNFAENANGILAGITTVMTGVKDILTAWQQQVRAGILLKIAGAIAILSVSLIALSLVDSEKLTGALTSITLLFANLFGALSIYEKTSGSGATAMPAMAKGIGAMIGLSVAVLILSGALAKIAKIDSADITKGILAIMALTAVLVAMSVTLSKNEATVVKGSLSMIAFAIALRALIGPIKALGEVNVGVLIQGLIGLGAMLTEINLFMKNMKVNVANLDDLFGILILAGAISALKNVITQLGNLDSGTLTKGLASLGILMASLAAFAKVATVGSNFVITAAAMLILSGAMLVLSDVIEKFGNMSIEQMSTALLGLGGSLAIFAVALNAMTGGIAGAGALLVAAGALVILAPALRMLGSMSLEQVGIGLLAMAGAFTVLGLAGLILTPVVPTLIGLGIAIGIIGLAALAAGVGILALSTGLATLAITGAAGSAAMAALLLALASVIPALAIAAANGIIEFAKTINKGAPAIFAAGKTLMIGFIKSFYETIPLIVDTVLTFITSFLSTVADHMPEILDSGYKIIVSFLTGIRDNVGKVVPIAYDIIINFLDAISSKLPEMAMAGWNLIISYINSIADAAEENIPLLMDAVRNLGLAIVKGVLKGLVEGHADAKAGIAELGKILIDGFKENLGIHSPSSVFTLLTGYIVDGVVNGLRINAFKALNEMKTLGENIVNALKGKYDSMVTAGKDLVTGFGIGIQKYISTAVKNAGDLATQVLDKIKDVLGIHSPADTTIEAGKFVDMGLATGITRFAVTVVKATGVLGEQTIDAFSNIISKVSDLMSTDMDFNPTITPVMDLTSFNATNSKFEDMLNNSGKTINVSGTVAKAALATSVGKAPTQVENTTGDNARPVIQYTQNNYSPKELSRIDIYRQTKNQLLQLKGTAGV